MILLTRLALRKNVPELAPEREEEASLLTEAVRRLNAGLGGNIELESFCKGLGCSPQKLRRLFAEAFAEPPGQYLQKLRLAEAKRLLAETGFTAKEVCGLVGFADPNYFSRLFRQKEGLSPLAYREEARRRR
jgi:transcriptional regulator GlxA family with amidase domain